MKVPRWAKILVAFLVLVVGGYVASQIDGRSRDIPAAFSDARLQGALIAQGIVNLSNESVGDLEKIEAFDRKGAYNDALALAVQAANRSKDIRDEAVRLSSELERMTTALSRIDSEEARNAAVESISSRLALLSRLINYSGYLGELIDALRERFTGAVPQRDVGALVSEVNAEVTAINTLNAQAGQAMDRFDQILKK